MVMLALAFVLLTLVVLAVVVFPVIRGARAVPERAQFDRAVYRDQLAELDRDVARGLLGGREAEMARLEIERRLLATDAGAPVAPAQRGRSPRLAGAIALLIAAGASGLYFRIGAPQIPDTPFASRGAQSDVAASNAHPDMEKMAAALAAKLQAAPDNVEGWLLLARTEGSLEHWHDAIDAYRHALTLQPDRSDAEAGYGEMLVLAAEGVVTPAAHDAFASALKHDPKNDVAQYYLALADAQVGNTSAAIASWLKLAAAEPDGELREAVAGRIAEAARAAGISPPALPPPAPPPAAEMDADADAPGDPAAMAAVAQMPPEQRTAMIQTMVGQLAQKLQSNPDDLAGWLRLGRSYAVLGQTDKAAEAYDHAAKLKPEDVSIPLQEVDALLSAQTDDDAMPAPVIALLHRVEATDPNQPEVLWYLGIAAAQHHQIDDAKRYWQRLLPLLPADSDEHKKVTDALASLAGK